MKKIKLIKLSDDVFKGNHPNFIYEGHTEIGYMKKEPVEGQQFFLYIDEEVFPFFHTSEVTKELNEEGIFKTIYSTYKIEEL